MKSRYVFWAYGPTGEMCMVHKDLHVFVSRRIDTSDEAHYGKGTWLYIGHQSGGHKVHRVLNTEEDVLAAEQKETDRSRFVRMIEAIGIRKVEGTELPYCEDNVYVEYENTICVRGGGYTGFHTEFRFAVDDSLQEVNSWE